MTNQAIRTTRKQVRAAWCECAIEMREWSALDFADAYARIEARSKTFRI